MLENSPFELEVDEVDEDRAKMIKKPRKNCRPPHRRCGRGRNAGVAVCLEGEHTRRRRRKRAPIERHMAWHGAKKEAADGGGRSIVAG